MPLMFDMPMEKLRAYQGRNPRPSDFDAFWDRGLAEMKATDPNPEIHPAAFQAPFAECSDLFFTGTGGARVYAKLLRPKNVKDSCPVVLHFHGYSGASSEWFAYLPFVAAGCMVAALDCRGQGGRSEDRGGVMGGTLRGHIIRGLKGEPDNLYYRNVYLDTAMLARVVSGLSGADAGRLMAYGGSQGGGLTLACAALTPSVKKAAPCYPFLADYRRIWEMDQAKDAYWELQDYFRKFDPLHKTEEEVFLKLGYIDVQHLAPRIKAEILMPVGLMDTTCPPSTQFAAYNKIPSKKSLLVFPDYGHEALPGVGDEIFRFLTAA